MWYLTFSILCSSAIFIVFKVFENYKINTFQAIIVNYFTAFAIGITAHKNEINYLDIPNKPWFFGALLLASLFIIVFNLMAITSQKNGVSVAAVAGKMAVIIPVLFGILLYNEEVSLVKIVGVLIGLCAVYLITLKNNVKKGTLIFPLLLFFGAGIIDTIIKYIQTNYVNINETNLFSGILFGIAGVLGVIVYCIKPTAIKVKNIISGIVLGVINYYSIYYILKALENKNMQSAIVFSINNISIVAICTLLGLFVFKEKLTTKNWIGIGIAIISILLITL
jgi:drug/metabolite transporter (DMT)-like permease